VNNRSVVVGSREREVNTQSNRTGDMCRGTKESNELLYFTSGKCIYGSSSLLSNEHIFLSP